MEKALNDFNKSIQKIIDKRKEIEKTKNDLEKEIENKNKKYVEFLLNGDDSDQQEYHNFLKIKEQKNKELELLNKYWNDIAKNKILKNKAKKAHEELQGKVNTLLEQIKKIGENKIESFEKIDLLNKKEIQINLEIEQLKQTNRNIFSHFGKLDTKYLKTTKHYKPGLNFDDFKRNRVLNK